MMNRKGKVFIAILLGCLTPFADTLQMTCDSPTPALGSNFTCKCIGTVTDVELWRGDTVLTACFSSGFCFPSRDGYVFEIDTSSLVYSMTIISYSYLNCAEYKCSGLQNSSNIAVENITISRTFLDLSQTVSMSTPETNSTGNITVQTPCLFIPTIEVQEDIQTIWYKILNDTVQVLSSNENVIEFEDTCKDCSGVRARKLKVTLPYRAPETNSNGETELVEFMFGIFDRNNVSNGQNITSERKFIFSKNTMEPRMTTSNICSLYATECILIILGAVIGIIAAVIGVSCICKKYNKKGRNEVKNAPVELTHTQQHPAPINATPVIPCQDNGTMGANDTRQAVQIPDTTNHQSTTGENEPTSDKPSSAQAKITTDQTKEKIDHQSTTGENVRTSDKPSSAQANITNGQTKVKNDHQSTTGEKEPTS